MNLELIIVDDGSADKTKDVVESFEDPRIEYIYMDNWGGPARPRNVGIDRSKGEYVAFCDADDYWSTNKLEVQLKHFDNDIIAVGSSAIYIGELIFHKRRKKIKSNLILDFSDLLCKRTVPLSSLIVRSKGFMFDENEGLKFVEDLDFLLKITSATNNYIKFISEPLIYYRVHPGNESSDTKISENVFNVLEKYRDVISEEHINNLYYKCYFNLGFKSLRNGNPKAKDYFIMGFKYANIKRKCLLFMLVVFSKTPRILRYRVLLIYYKFCNFTLM